MIEVLLLAIAFWGDSAVYRAVQKAQSPAGLTVARVLSATGGKEAVLTIPMAYSFLGGEKAHRESKSMAVGAVTTGLLVTGIKYITNRPRPDGDYTRSNSSFPSGHAAVAFFYATYISERHPEIKWPVYLWATGVAASRIYLNRHWLSDVVVGAVIGWGIARLTLRYGKRLEEFKIYE